MGSNNDPELVVKNIRELVAKYPYLRWEIRQLENDEIRILGAANIIELNKTFEDHVNISKLPSDCVILHKRNYINLFNDSDGPKGSRSYLTIEWHGYFSKTFKRLRGKTSRDVYTDGPRKGKPIISVSRPSKEVPNTHRGHLVPNGNHRSHPEANKATDKATNIIVQVNQNGAWDGSEKGIRNLLPSPSNFKIESYFKNVAIFTSAFFNPSSTAEGIITGQDVAISMVKLLRLGIYSPVIGYIWYLFDIPNKENEDEFTDYLVGTQVLEKLDIQIITQADILVRPVGNMDIKNFLLKVEFLQSLEEHIKKNNLGKNLKLLFSPDSTDSGSLCADGNFEKVSELEVTSIDRFELLAKRQIGRNVGTPVYPVESMEVRETSCFLETKTCYSV